MAQKSEFVTVKREDLEGFLDGITRFLNSQPYGWQEFVLPNVVVSYENLRTALAAKPPKPAKEPTRNGC